MVLALFLAGWLQVPTGYKSVSLADGVKVTIPAVAVATGKIQKSKLVPIAESWETSNETFWIASLPLDGEAVTAVPDYAAANYISQILVEGDPTQILHEDEKLYDGWPGLEARLKQYRVRVYVIGGRYYELGVRTLRGTATPGDYDTFLDSLTITPAPTAGPLKKAGVDLQPFDIPKTSAHLLYPSRMEEKQESSSEGVTGTLFRARFGECNYMLVAVRPPKEKEGDAFDASLPTKLAENYHLERISQAKRHAADNRDVTTAIYGNDKMRAKFEWSHKDHVTYVMGLFFPPYRQDLPELKTYFESLKVDDAPKQ